MSGFDFDDAIDALREEEGAVDGVATRHRILDSLERAGQRRRMVLSFAVIVGLGLSGTTAWGWFSGAIPAHVRAVPLPPAAEIAAPPVAVRKVTRTQPTERTPSNRVPVPVIPPPPIVVMADPVTPARKRPVPAPLPPDRVPAEVPAPAPEVVPAPVATPAPAEVVPAPVATPAPAAPDAELAAYRRAHQAHFRGNDLGAALRAWDAYLSSYPEGRLSLEARWNRAVLLVRLGRHGEARRALAPFVEGTEGGYRQIEALRLLRTLPSASP